ncbi:MAG: ArsA family ATPase [Spirochaetales bacterium]|nr:ArsA family ATPase [Spirochaetales bacterium]
MKVIFFTGKGGVGKSTSSALFACKLAEKGYSVFLNSIDPAHNLHDLFNTGLSRKPKEVLPRLTIMETDLEFWVKRYLKETEKELKETYRYQEAFNLHKYFTTLKYSPGLEEYAVLLALQDSIEKYSSMDYIIFDTPPTALTLKFLALPSVSLLWLQELIAFRKMILKKKNIITKILDSKNNKEREKDHVLLRIEKLIATYSELNRIFTDTNQTSIFLVLNPDKLSLSESKDIRDRLKDLNISLPYVILNKLKNRKEIPDHMMKEFPESTIFTIEKQNDEIIGFDMFRRIDLEHEINIVRNR